MEKRRRKGSVIGGARTSEKVPEKKVKPGVYSKGCKVGNRREAYERDEGIVEEKGL
jgi:hypothetical protein